MKDVHEDGKQSLPKEISLLSAITMIAGMIIGSGIFFTPFETLSNSGSVGAAFIVWTAAGFLAVGGGLCYCELGSSLPHCGGELVYFNRAYGQLAGFLYVWMAALFSRPVSQAVICVAFASYFVQPLYNNSGKLPSRFLISCVGVAAAMVLGVVNAVSSRAAVRMIVVLAYCKIVALIGIVLMAGYWAVMYGPESLSTGFKGTVKDPRMIGLAFYGALWAFDGWQNLNFVAEEIHDPQRNLPRGILMGLLIVIVCYLAVNLSYFTVLSKSEFSDAVANVAGVKVLGKTGNFVVPLCVALSTLGAACGSCMVSSRILVAAGREGLLPKLVSILHKEKSTPIIAIVIHIILSCIFISVGTLESLVNAFSFIQWIICGAAFMSVYVLRWKEPDLNRPYKVCIWLPGLMTLVSAYLVIVPILQHPSYFLITLLLVPGIAVFFVFFKDHMKCKKLRQLNDAMIAKSMILFNSS